LETLCGYHFPANLLRDLTSRVTGSIELLAPIWIDQSFEANPREVWVRGHYYQYMMKSSKKNCVLLLTTREYQIHPRYIDKHDLDVTFKGLEVEDHRNITLACEALIVVARTLHYALIFNRKYFEIADRTGLTWCR
jgi:hypothetical protein